MKKYTLFSLILCVVAFSSCHKNNSSKNTDSGYYLSSAVSVTAGTSIVDSFTYDSAHRITQFIQTKYDTTTGTPAMTVATTQFTLAAGTDRKSVV